VGNRRGFFATIHLTGQAAFPVIGEMYRNTLTDILTGTMGFTASLTVPASALFTGSFTAPIDVSAMIRRKRSFFRTAGKARG
jgi:hypothetical protein